MAYLIRLVMGSGDETVATRYLVLVLVCAWAEGEACMSAEYLCWCFID